MLFPVNIFVPSQSTLGLLVWKITEPYLSKILIENMIHHKGVGLSANQIGIWERAFVMVKDLQENEIIVCFNPKILKSYKDDNSKAWKDILGGTDFQIVEEEQAYNDITTYTEEPE